MSAPELAGKTAVISGVGPGLGRELAGLFARHGARVVLAARGAAFVAEVAAEVVAAGGEAVPVVADITDPAGCEAIIEAAASGGGEGGVDVLVNNAFAFGPRQLLEEIDLDEWRAPLEVNLLGTLRLSLVAAEAMAKRGGGSIVMVNTQAIRRSEPRRGPYSASKAALLSVSRTMAAEWGPRSVRVNSVVPGHIWGPPLEAFFAERARRLGVSPQTVYDEVADDLPLRRIATSADVAEAVLFFASDRSSAITGQSLDVNGGNWFD